MADDPGCLCARATGRVTVQANSCRTDRGFALLVVLWTLVFLGLLIAHLAASGRNDAVLTGNLLRTAKLEAAADGAIHQVIFGLMRRDEERLAASGIYRVRISRNTVTVRVQNQTGLVNPNVVQPQLLRALMIELGVHPPAASSLAAAIVDWRSQGQTPSDRGAKAPQYRAAGLAYGPPGESFRDIGELSDVLGMTPELLQRLKPHLTLWWDGEPDPALADPVVQSALRGTGNGPADGRERNDSFVVALSALAVDGKGGAAARRAIVRVGFSPDGRGWRGIAWDRVNSTSD